jgi:hypothetical protein
VPVLCFQRWRPRIHLQGLYGMFEGAQGDVADCIGLSQRWCHDGGVVVDLTRRRCSYPLLAVILFYFDAHHGSMNAPRVRNLLHGHNHDIWGGYLKLSAGASGTTGASVAAGASAGAPGYGGSFRLGRAALANIASTSSAHSSRVAMF